jgi:hypothetical protein
MPTEKFLKYGIATESIKVAAPVDTTATPAFKPAVPGRFAE